MNDDQPYMSIRMQLMILYSKSKGHPLPFKKWMKSFQTIRTVSRTGDQEGSLQHCYCTQSWLVDRDMAEHALWRCNAGSQGTSRPRAEDIPCRQDCWALGSRISGWHLNYMGLVDWWSIAKVGVALGAPREARPARSQSASSP